MFLITPEFTVRVDRVHKIFPHKDGKGSYVDVINNHDQIDREHTSLEYNTLIGVLKGVQRHGL
jgi:hypothetical protein